MAERMLRCAVYTRKSTDDGLEQEFNSLDAQYEACAAYALSQKHEGWLLVPARYDDGGYSGGNIQRPGLTRLLADVAAGKVDIILLYKIDRLTRSLTDFAKIVEVLDKAGASFVSITQSFNTTTSMGRLTLNMLLSFAQFEREVTGERIRDKVAASRRKGMWMGGRVPLGYDLCDGKLAVNEEEAKLIRLIMQRYLELGSVGELIDELNRGGYTTKRRPRGEGETQGCAPFRRSAIYYLLANPIYIGCVRHKNEQFAGEHAAIVSVELWTAVQKKLKTNTLGDGRQRGKHQPSILLGLLMDGEGRAMGPTHTARQGKRYRYYVTRPDLVGASRAWRVPAHDLEQQVCERVCEVVADQHFICGLAKGLSADDISRALANAKSVAGTLRFGPAVDKARLLSQLVDRVALRADGFDLSVARAGLAASLAIEGAVDLWHPHLVVSSEAIKVRRGTQHRLVIPGPTAHMRANRDDSLLELLVAARQAQQLVLSREGQPIAEIAAKSRRCPRRLRKLFGLSCLAPEIVTAILEGLQPVSLTPRGLLEVDLPLQWSEQKRVLGFG